MEGEEEMEIVGKREECTQNDAKKSLPQLQITRPHCLLQEASQNLIENDWEKSGSRRLIENDERIEKGI